MIQLGITTTEETMLANPFWSALRSEHARFALGEGPVLRYPVDVIPFAGMQSPSAEHLLALRNLMAPGEKIFVVADHLCDVNGLSQTGELPGLQLHFDGDIRLHEGPESAGFEIQKLGREDVPAMVSLTDIAFPGFFRERTYELGAYFGVFNNRALIAMAGERIALPGSREISAVCTHPKHTGNGYARALISHLLVLHAEHQLRSFLHVAEKNTRAISLYRHLGFVTRRPVHFRQLQRAAR